LANGKNYLLVSTCSKVEDHDGEKWIDENEYNKLRQRSEAVSSGCEYCKLTVKDLKGDVLMEREGC